MMSMHAVQPLFDTTIVAIATPLGDGAVGVVRLSGPDSFMIANRLFKPANKKSLRPWVIAYGTLHQPDQPEQLIDEVLVLPFKAPKSFTGEDVIEFQVHGGQRLTEAVLRLCLACGAQPAQAGEYTQRAFLNGRLDLSQAESVLDLIQAQGTELMSAATQNLQQRTLGQTIDTLCESIMTVQAAIVASVDFPDEVDEPERAPLVQQLQAVQQRVQGLMSTVSRYQWLKHGITVALVGQPNAGKSSLFNALLAHERAIVTDIAGTTRDTISEKLTIHGVPVTLVDTAGLRDSGDPIEQLGVERSRAAVEQADKVLYVYDASLGWTEQDDALLSELKTFTTHRKDTKCLANQIDTWATMDTSPYVEAGHHRVSAKTGEGVSEIMAQLECWVADPSDKKPEGDINPSYNKHTACAVNHRQHACLDHAESHLNQAMLDLSDENIPIDLVTVPLTDALRAIERVTGRDSTEDMLTEVFHTFCVGK